MTYQWTKNGTQTIRDSSSILTFSPLKLSDAGMYTCRVDISSDYLDSTLSAHNSIPLNVQSKLFKLKFKFSLFDLFNYNTRNSNKDNSRKN